MECLWRMDALFWASNSWQPFTAITKHGRARMFIDLTLIVFIWKKKVIYCTQRMAWRWVNHRAIFIFWWTIPLILTQFIKKTCYVYCVRLTGTLYAALDKVSLEMYKGIQQLPFNVGIFACSKLCTKCISFNFIIHLIWHTMLLYNVGLSRFVDFSRLIDF